MTTGSLLAGLSLQRLVEILAFVFLGAGCISEWRRRRFTNWMTLPALAAIAAWRLAVGEWQFLLVWAACFYFWLRGWYGGGDVKVLMVVTGVRTGWQYLAWLVVGLTLIYGVWALTQQRGRIGSWLWTLPVHAVGPPVLARDKVFVIPLTAVTAMYYVAQ